MNIKKSISGSRKILVFNPSFIGDAILTTPLLNALEKLFPYAEIDFCIRPESAPLFKNLYNLIPFDKRKSLKGLKGIIRFAETIRKNRYDFIINLHKSFRTALTLKLSQAPVYGFSESAFSFSFKAAVSRDMSLHEVERNLMLLSLLTDNFSLAEAKLLAGKPKTYLDEKFYNEIRTKLSVTEKKTIAVNAGSVWFTKRWPTEKFAEVIKTLSKKYNIILIGGPGDEETNNSLKKILDNNISYLDYANKIDFSKVPALIKACDVLISNDSAPVHIAVSQSVPVVAIFGATVPALGFTPYDDKSVICEIPLKCRPCGLHGANKCPQKHFKCMNELPESLVINAAERLLS